MGLRVRRARRPQSSPRDTIPPWRSGGGGRPSVAGASCVDTVRARFVYRTAFACARACVGAHTTPGQGRARTHSWRGGRGSRSSSRSRLLPRLPSRCGARAHCCRLPHCSASGCAAVTWSTPSRRRAAFGGRAIRARPRAYPPPYPPPYPPRPPPARRSGDGRRPVTAAACPPRRRRAAGCACRRRRAAAAAPPSCCARAERPAACRARACARRRARGWWPRGGARRRRPRASAARASRAPRARRAARAPRGPRLGDVALDAFDRGVEGALEALHVPLDGAEEVGLEGLERLAEGVARALLGRVLLHDHLEALVLTPCRSCAPCRHLEDHPREGDDHVLGVVAMTPNSLTSSPASRAACSSSRTADCDSPRMERKSARMAIWRRRGRRGRGR